MKLKLQMDAQFFILKNEGGRRSACLCHATPRFCFLNSFPVSLIAYENGGLWPLAAWDCFFQLTFVTAAFFALVAVKSKRQ